MSVQLTVLRPLLPLRLLSGLTITTNNRLTASSLTLLTRRRRTPLRSGVTRIL